MLKQRIATALVLIVLFLGALFLAPLSWFCVFIGAIVLAAAWEWSNLAGLQHIAAKLGYVAASGILLWLSGYYLVDASTDTQILFLSGAGLWWLIALLWVASFPGSARLWGNRWLKALMGWLVLLPTWVALAVLLNKAGPESGRWLVLVMVLIVVLMDTGGYVAGRLFGRRKLAPQVSPGKTWAGFYGGLFANVLLLATVGLLLADDLGGWLTVALLVIVSACASVLGDLLESMVKRQRNIKDSGAILPGHGGVLDRIDGMTAAFPVFALLYLLRAEGFV